MDPQANILRQMRIVERINKINDTYAEGTEPLPELADMAFELAELVEALDGWMRQGGFLPARWARRD